MYFVVVVEDKVSQFVLLITDFLFLVFSCILQMCCHSYTGGKIFINHFVDNDCKEASSCWPLYVVQIRVFWFKHPAHMVSTLRTNTYPPAVAWIPGVLTRPVSKTLTASDNINILYIIHTHQEERSCFSKIDSISTGHFILRSTNQHIHG